MFSSKFWEVVFDCFLTDDVRQKYILELKNHNESWLSKLKSELKDNNTGFWVFVTSVLVLLALLKGIHELGAKGGWWDALWLIFLVGPAFGTTAILSNFIDGFQSYERELRNHSDEMLELLYNEMKERKHFKKLSSQIVTTIVAVGMGILFFLALSSENDNIIKRFWNNLTTDAKCSVISTNANEDSFLISGKPDYGITVSSKIKNVGKKGNVFVISKVSSSEGNLERKQSIFMEAGAVKRLKYQFAELTINAKNVNPSVSCSPSGYE